MAIPAVIVGIAAAAAAAPEVIDKIKHALDALGFDRSCIIELVNTTDERLKLVRSGHDSGGFEQPPAPFLEPRSTMVFSSRSTAAGRGAVGNIGFDGNGFTLFMDWSNPFAGSNDLDASVVGPRANEFVAYAEDNPGHTNARFRCVLSYTDPARYAVGPRSRFASFNFPDRCIRHRNFLGEVTPLDQLAADFQFDVIGRGPGLVALRSVNFPDRFLRHQNFEVKLQPPAGIGDLLWVQDTTFHLDPGLADPGAVTFRSTNFGDRYIRHRNFKLYLEPGDTPLLRADATFRRIPV
ncbi:AbfB domain-containing protein [Dactylosporangium sp. NPDC049525]|uniref:AbfB domain-containing protein n=1 Tax=Dactylosporangium sp. NPDC049525 TaxID=3154730 RepID=UPI003439F3E3